MSNHNQSDGPDALMVGGGAVAGAAVVGIGVSGLSAAAPIIAGVVALAVAVITAVTTDRRQGVALKAQQLRLDAQLSAEAQRLREQLGHDRRLANVAELRAVIDESLASTRKARAILVNHRGREAPSGLTEAGAKVGYQSSRLATRAGRTSPIAVALVDVVSRLSDWTQAILDIDEALEHVDTDDIDRDLEACEDQFDVALRQFENAAFEEVGAVDVGITSTAVDV